MHKWSDEDWWALDANSSGDLQARLNAAGVPCVGVRNRAPILVDPDSWRRAQEALGLLGSSFPSAPDPLPGAESAANSPAPKRRGRPPGSKNKLRPEVL